MRVVLPRPWFGSEDLNFGPDLNRKVSMWSEHTV